MSPLLGVVMKAEIAHDVALMAARTSRLMERRSLKMQEASDSVQGVEELYAVIVQKCLAMGSRLSPNMEQKRKSVKTHYVASGIAGKDYSVPGAVHGVPGVVADAHRVSLIEAQLARPQRPLEVQEFVAGVPTMRYGVPGAILGVHSVVADADIVAVMEAQLSRCGSRWNSRKSPCVKIHARLSQRLVETRRILEIQETATRGFTKLTQAGADVVYSADALDLRVPSVQGCLEMQSSLSQSLEQKRRSLVFLERPSIGVAELSRRAVKALLRIAALLRDRSGAPNSCRLFLGVPSC